MAVERRNSALRCGEYFSIGTMSTMIGGNSSWEVREDTGAGSTASGANPVRTTIGVRRWLLLCAVEGIDELAKFILKQELLKGVITADVGERLPLDHVVATIER